jgi:hypothetical protein
MKFRIKEVDDHFVIQGHLVLWYWYNIDTWYFKNWFDTREKAQATLNHFLGALDEDVR